MGENLNIRAKYIGGLSILVLFCICSMLLHILFNEVGDLIRLVFYTFFLPSKFTTKSVL